MPKATSRSRASARLQTPGAEGAEEGAILERKTAGEVALEAVTELDSKFEEWHLHTSMPSRTWHRLRQIAPRGRRGAARAGGCPGAHERDVLRGGGWRGDAVGETSSGETP